MIWLISFLLLSGAAFTLVAALGILRMPDVYCRMHAATKAGAFGVSLLVFALILASPTIRVLLQGGLLIGFFYMTAPVAAQMLGRVALKMDLPQWQPQPHPEKSPLRRCGPGGLRLLYPVGVLKLRPREKAAVFPCRPIATFLS
jgi:multicomponent Na+:H+ antiporter subunit G